MTNLNKISCKRVYEPADPSDGKRVFVDRLWPRGIKKDSLKMDLWLKEAAPSTPLRQWYHQHLDQQESFTQQYQAELAANPTHWLLLLDFIKQGHLTLLYAAKNTEFNHALVLAAFLEDELEKWHETSSPSCYRHLFNDNI